MFRRIGALSLILSGLGLLTAPSAHATLGERFASVESDKTSLRATLATTPRAGFDVHEMTLPSGTVVREFAAATGVVFAVAWKGPAMPDLRQTLGKYFADYSAQAQTRQSGRNRLHVSRSDLVIEAGGHMRAFLDAPTCPPRCHPVFPPTISVNQGTTMINFRWVGFMVLAALVTGCGGGSGGSGGGSSSVAPSNLDPIAGAASNVAATVVDAGPAGSLNTLFTSVKICAPGTSRCQTIDHVEIDTGSSGLRLLASVLDSSLALPVVEDSNHNTLVECIQFVDGFSWGPVATADFTISGETVNQMPVQIIGSSIFPNVPPACSSTGPAEDTVATFGANGILGVSVLARDCGPACAQSSSPGVYYFCSSTTCSPTIRALTDQVPNPVPLFATDNNGIIIQLPSIAAAGAASATGAIVFGVDTQNNNASGSKSVLTLDPDNGSLTTQFNGATLSDGFFDTGSNGFFFTDTSLAKCSGNTNDFYCPSGTQNFSATAKGINNVAVSIDFGIANLRTLQQNNSSFVAFDNIGGTSASSDSFVWGLPFFFGRSVYYVFENAASSAGTGPYIAF